MIIFVLLFLTALLWGTSPILEKIGLRNTAPFIALTIRSLSVSVALLIALTCMGKIKDIFSVDGKTMTLFIVSGIMAGLLGMWAYFGALKAGATSKIVPIAASYPLITALLSVIILKEAVTPLRLIGTLLIIAGIWLVK
ncbi:MAG: EamA family transporter [Candidatus Omnitrophota bacterium]|nr:MAG: EamA family transporter [Candidatus Omnitrophota bacterium]